MRPRIACAGPVVSYWLMIVQFTDFGLAGPYMGQMEAVLRRLAPEVPVVTLFADAPAFRPRASAYLLSAYAPEFPEGTVFLCVVDPGVGGERACGFLEADGRWFVGPENGLLAIVARRAGTRRWFELTDLPPEASATFHGRDVLAPAAARLAIDGRPACVEKPVAEVMRPDWPEDLAEIVYIDGFGNAMTGIRASQVEADAEVAVGDGRLRTARTFSDVPRGEAFWYGNSNGLVEIAVNGGRACDHLGLTIGDSVAISKV